MFREGSGNSTGPTKAWAAAPVSGDLRAGSGLVLCFVCCLFLHSRVAFPCFWVGNGGGERRVCSHLHSCVYTSLVRDCLGFSLSALLCPLGETLFDSPVGFTREGLNEQRVSVQRGLEGRRKGEKLEERGIVQNSD